MNKLQQLEARIQEAVPEKVMGTTRKELTEAFLGNSKAIIIGKLGITDGTNKPKRELVERMVKISLDRIGRPITLDDVLRAIENSENSRRFMLETDGEIMYYSGGEPRFFFEARWKLGSPLQDQPEETIDFLHSLIVKE